MTKFIWRCKSTIFSSAELLTWPKRLATHVDSARGSKDNTDRDWNKPKRVLSDRLLCPFTREKNYANDPLTPNSKSTRASNHAGDFPLLLRYFLNISRNRLFVFYGYNNNWYNMYNIFNDCDFFLQQ